MQSFDRSSLYKLVSKFKARSKVKQTEPSALSRNLQRIIKEPSPTQRVLTADGWACGSSGKGQHLPMGETAPN